MGVSSKSKRREIRVKVDCKYLIIRFEVHSRVKLRFEIEEASKLFKSCSFIFCAQPEVKILSTSVGKDSFSTFLFIQNKSYLALSIK